MNRECVFVPLYLLPSQFGYLFCDNSTLKFDWSRMCTLKLKLQTEVYIVSSVQVYLSNVSVIADLMVTGVPFR